jgi:hypothetical protein
MSAPHRWHMAIWAAIAVVLLLPLVAMQLTDEVNWTVFDFAAAAILLGGAGVVYELAARRTPSPRRRAVIGAALVAAVLLLWAQGAVGIFG